jgi:TldD protein
MKYNMYEKDSIVGLTKINLYILELEQNHMSDVLSLALESPASFTLVRRHKREYFQVDSKEGTPNIRSSTVEGTSVRCLKDGSWGFACSTDPGDFKTLVETAEKAARVSAAKKREQCFLDSLPVLKEKWQSPVRKVTQEHAEEIIQYLKEADVITLEYPEIISRQISFLSTCDEKEIATSEGTVVTQKEYRIFCTAAVTAHTTNKATSNNAVGGQWGEEVFKKDDLHKMIREECERAIKLSAARMPPAGVSKVVLAPEVASVLMHEAVGHTAEADVVAEGSYLSERLEEKVAADCVTIVDDGTVPGGFGTYGFDDEGVPSQKTPIIEKGVLKTYLHSRESAYTTGGRTTGNARAWLYSREPLIRMTNTYLDPDTYSFEELAQEVDTGLFLRGVTSGLADHVGNFILYVPEAQKIEHKTLTGTVYAGVTVSANAFQLLSSMTAVGDDSTFLLIPGVCGKGETAFVGMGAPAFVTTVVVGGEV